MVSLSYVRPYSVRPYSGPSLLDTLRERPEVNRRPSLRGERHLPDYSNQGFGRMRHRSKRRFRSKIKSLGLAFIVGGVLTTCVLKQGLDQDIPRKTGSFIGNAIESSIYWMGRIPVYLDRWYK